MRSNMMGAGSENRIHTNAKDNQLASAVSDNQLLGKQGLKMLEKVAPQKGCGVAISVWHC